MKRNILQPVSSNFNTDEITIMELTYKKYGSLSGWQLSAITHAPGTPWHTAWTEGQYIRGYSIKNEVIKEYYKNLIEVNQNQ